jgi:hypothetical protein
MFDPARYTLQHKGIRAHCLLRLCIKFLVVLGWGFFRIIFLLNFGVVWGGCVAGYGGVVVGVVVGVCVGVCVGCALRVFA